MKLNNYLTDLFLIILTAVLTSLLVLFILDIFIGEKNQDCIKILRNNYISDCCYNATDVNGDGYLSFEENDLYFGDFGMFHNMETKGCICSGYHQQREFLLCKDSKWFWIF